MVTEIRQRQSNVVECSTETGARLVCPKRPQREAARHRRR